MCLTAKHTSAISCAIISSSPVLAVSWNCMQKAGQKERTISLNIFTGKSFHCTLSRGCIPSGLRCSSDSITVCIYNTHNIFGWN